MNVYATEPPRGWSKWGNSAGDKKNHWACRLRLQGLITPRRTRTITTHKPKPVYNAKIMWDLKANHLKSQKHKNPPNTEPKKKRKNEGKNHLKPQREQSIRGTDSSRRREELNSERKRSRRRERQRWQQNRRAHCLRLGLVATEMSLEKADDGRTTRGISLFKIGENTAPAQSANWKL